MAQIKPFKKILFALISTFLMFLLLSILPLFINYNNAFLLIFINYAILQGYFMIPIIFKIKKRDESTTKVPIIIIAITIVWYLLAPDKDDIMPLVYVLIVTFGYIYVNYNLSKIKSAFVFIYGFLYMMIILLIQLDKHFFRGCGRALSNFGIKIYKREPDPYTPGLDLDFFPAYIDALIFCFVFFIVQCICFSIFNLIQRIIGQKESSE